MEEKRTFIAIGLSLVIFIGWSYLAEYMGWVSPRQVPEPQAISTPAQETANLVTKASEAPLPVFTPSEGQDVQIETPFYTATLYSGGGILRSLTLKQYHTGIETAAPLVNLVSPDTAATSPLGLTINGQPSWSVGNWSFAGENLNLQPGQSSSLTFTGEIEGVRVSRVISFNADNYLFSENILLSSADGKPRSVRLGFLVAATQFGVGQYDPTRMAWSANSKFDEETSADTLMKTGLQEIGVFNWAGIMSNYFMNVVSPGDPLGLTLKGRVQGDVWRVALERPEILIPGQGEVPIAVNWWFGPKDRNLLATVPGDLTGTVDFGFFTIIAKPLLIVLEFFQAYVHNWGIAIILLTLSIRIAFWPLSQKSYKSMEQMKKLQPMMQKIREKHANDKEALNREVMQLYKTYKVNPAGGCLPIVVQIPVFIGLYQALLNSIELRHASFITHLPFTNTIWLADLSAADPFYITPLIMGATMFLQQKLTPAAGDPTQQKIMMFMPLIFTFMFLNFPAGLVIYWLFNNVLSIAQQWWMLRKA